MKESSIFGSFNWMCGSPGRPRGNAPRSGFILGRYPAVTSRHFLDAQYKIHIGEFSAIALLIIFYWMLRQFLLLLQHDHRAMPWLVYLVTSFIWAFLFSPFGVEARLIIGLFLALHVLSTIGGANTRRSRI
jgi:hypothetical protein